MTVLRCRVSVQLAASYCIKNGDSSFHDVTIARRENRRLGRELKNVIMPDSLSL